MRRRVLVSIWQRIEAPKREGLLRFVTKRVPAYEGWLIGFSSEMPVNCEMHAVGIVELDNRTLEAHPLNMIEFIDKAPEA